MIVLKDWMELVDFKITEGSDYYHNNQTLYVLDSWDGNNDGCSLSVVFDPKDDQRVYFVEVCDYKNQRAYRRTYETPVDNIAWDGVEWVDLETDEDFIEKATAIKAGEEYDTRISIPLTLSDDEQLELFKLAHSRDMTFNKYVEMIIEQKLAVDDQAK